MKNACFPVRPLYRGSLAEKVVDFFQRNPDEYLTAEDIQLKFAASNPREQLRASVKAGLLEKHPKPLRFTAGPLLGRARL